MFKKKKGRIMFCCQFPFREQLSGTIQVRSSLPETFQRFQGKRGKVGVRNEKREGMIANMFAFSFGFEINIEEHKRFF